MSSETDESTLRTLLDLISQQNSRNLDWQHEASLAARLQFEAEQQLLQRNHLLLATQRRLQHRQLVTDAFQQAHLNNAHINGLDRLQETQYLRQASQYGGNQSVMVYVPTTSAVPHSLPRAVSGSQSADVLDLTIDDDQEEKEEELEEAKNKAFTTESRSQQEISENVARKRKSDEVSSNDITSSRKLPVSHNYITNGRKKAMPTERQVAPPPDYVPPKSVQTKEVSLLAKELLGQIEPTGGKAFLKGPLILTPSQLKMLTKLIKSQAKEDARAVKDKEIAQLQSQLEKAKKKAADVEEIKKAYAMEVDEVRIQSQRAMQAYMKATVNAFERLQQAKDDNDD